MGMTKTHWLLCAADDLPSACTSVQMFFRNSLLIHYDAVRVVSEESGSAETDFFWSTLDTVIAENRVVLSEMIEELTSEGFETFADLTSLPAGYPSKVLHTIAHLLDGFIGIDSVFYNLVEDSHWLSERLRGIIMHGPARYWLIRIEASFQSAETASLIYQHHQEGL